MPVIDHHLFILRFHFFFFQKREEANERAESCSIYIQKSNCLRGGRR